MYQVLLLVHVVICIALIGLVLLQQGKGAEIGASFGSGASQTVFGSQGSISFLVKITGVLAALFFVTSLTLGFMASHATTKVNSALPIPANSAPVVPSQAPQKTVPANNTSH